MSSAFKHTTRLNILLRGYHYSYHTRGPLDFPSM